MDCVLLLCSLALFVLIEITKADIYSHTWAAHIEGGEEVAKQLAEKHKFTFLEKIFDDHYHLSHNQVSKRSTIPNDVHHNNLKQEPEVRWLEQQIVKKRVKRDISFNDPKWPLMWYLNRGGGLDMNVKSAWQKGHRGKGVVVSILDDGIEKDHPDLKNNYDPRASYDVNGHDSDPQPRYDYTNENRHGTRCAGEVAAEANNGVCSVGAAFEASIGGVRMLDGDVTDAVEAQSLSLNPEHIDIYSASWGPDDDGRTVDGPARMAQRAFSEGIAKGRGGKGNIFVWASGNGGRDQDSCNCDGYTNSIYTLSISSATESGHIPWYSEACSSTLSTTYSSGSGKEHQVITTDLRKGCTETHTGTSASAPLAAGICAIALSANKALTWRDMQHIVVMTSRPGNLKATDWVTNGVGRKVSHSFGFGLMDASAMVDLALNWTTVPRQKRCEIRSVDSPRTISVNGKVSVSIVSMGCRNTRDEVIYLEHVQAVITLTTSRRGQVQIFLTSPQGTRSTLLTKRPRDISTEGFNEWAFMTTHNWGEYSLGTWTLEIENDGATSTLHSWSLVMYGTSTDPLTDQTNQHPHPPSQECEDGKLVFNNMCVEKCPVSFYPANQTMTPTMITTSSTTTAETTTTTTTTATMPNATTTPKNLSNTTLSFTNYSQPTTTPSVTSSTTVITDAASDRTTVTLTTTTENATVTLVCKPCSPGCAECINEVFCLKCLDKYNMTMNNTCVAENFNIIKYFKTHMDFTFIVITIFLCILAVMAFFCVFCMLQLMEPDSYICCNNRYNEYDPVEIGDDVEFGKNRFPSKLSGLKNGDTPVRYKNGTDGIGLLDSEESESEVFDGHSSEKFNSVRYS